MLRFRCHDPSRPGAPPREVDFEPSVLVIAGWAGRDRDAVEHHIEELAALGVPRPSRVPTFYRVAASLLTQAPRVQMLGADGSGEVEPVLVHLADGLWLGVGSDHTDRKAEAHGVALSKQMCAKPVGRDLVRLDAVREDWDTIRLRAHATIRGERVLYQDGPLASLRPPADLLARLAEEGGALPSGGVLFGGTLGAIGGVRPGTRFEMELEAADGAWRVAHAYDVDILPIVA